MFRLSSWKAMVVLSVFCFATAVAARSQTLTTLADFNDPNGSTPGSTLIQATDGNFYGTTISGGAYGAGTVFKVTPNGELTTLYSFCAQSGCPDGREPLVALVQGTDGNFYGTTSLGGGANKYGTVFKITPEGQLTTLHVFNGADGTGAGPLIQASNGNFYGATYNGGGSNACNGGCGTIFEITPAGGFTTLHSFTFTDGYMPSGLIQANDGNFYGTTTSGGVVSNACLTGPGCGTVFEMTPTGQLSTLHKFQVSDGSRPSAGLLQGTDGNFYGTTYYGGASNACNNLGCGTVFVITPAGNLTTLHSFDITEGNAPQAGLVQATDGNLYGTAQSGGPAAVLTCQIFPCNQGYGTIFEITPEGEFTNLLNFDDTDGSTPWGGLVQATDGNFYGTTIFGGAGGGTVFSLSTGLAPFVKLTPASGEAGVAVTILGTDLTGSTKVTFNGKPAQFKVVSSTEIQATVPAETSTGKVEVNTPQGALSSNVPFQVPLHPEMHHGRPLLKL